MGRRPRHRAAVRQPKAQIAPTLAVAVTPLHTHTYERTDPQHWLSRTCEATMVTWERWKAVPSLRAQASPYQEATTTLPPSTVPLMAACRARGLPETCGAAGLKGSRGRSGGGVGSCHRPQQSLFAGASSRQPSRRINEPLPPRALLAFKKRKKQGACVRVFLLVRVCARKEIEREKEREELTSMATSTDLRGRAPGATTSAAPTA